MPKVTINDAYQMAATSYRSGRLGEAESICRQILNQDRSHCNALGLLGLITGETGRDEMAVDFFKRALLKNPRSHLLYSNLGEGYRRLGRLDKARTAFQQAIVLNPKFFQAHNNLGVAWKDAGHPDQAAAAFRKAISLDPSRADALNNLGIVLLLSDEPEEAVTIFRQAVAAGPGDAEAHLNLGIALVKISRNEEAAIEFSQAIRLDPGLPFAHSNLGNLLKERGQLDDAAAAYHRAIALNPGLAEIHNNLGNVLVEIGQLEDALAAFRRAIALKPEYVETHSGLMFYLNYDIHTDGQTLAAELRHWNLRHAASIHPSSFHPNDRNPNRRLRVGYVSPDLREHVVAQFLLPILENYNPDHSEIFCYAQVARPDAVTKRCEAAVDHWRNLVGLSDDQAADLIRQDGIDILVDLAMHTSNHRLLVFARKPAPVQVTYLAYAGSTGLETMDYRLSDPHLDPPQSDVSIYSEKTVRLPHTYWCYKPAHLSPPITLLSTEKREYFTFGCLNNFCKVNGETLEAWICLLQAVPNARLLLHAPEGSARARIRDTFSTAGVQVDRLEFTGRVPVLDYLRLYNQIDIALDPFPFGGGTTTCDALWMGVPVVSLAGTRAVGRGGLSILSNVGLTDLVAEDRDGYVEIAAKLARSPKRLEELRADLRGRMERSPLMDARAFSRDLEAIYRKMWSDWCGS